MADSYAQATGGYNPPQDLNFATWQGSTQAWQNAVQDALKKGWNPTKADWDKATQYAPMKSYYDEQYANRANLNQPAGPKSILDKTPVQQPATPAPKPTPAPVQPATPPPTAPPPQAPPQATAPTPTRSTLTTASMSRPTTGPASPPPAAPATTPIQSTAPVANTSKQQQDTAYQKTLGAPQTTSYFDNQMKTMDRVASQSTPSPKNVANTAVPQVMPKATSQQQQGMAEKQSATPQVAKNTVNQRQMAQAQNSGKARLLAEEALKKVQFNRTKGAAAK